MTISMLDEITDRLNDNEVYCMIDNDAFFQYQNLLGDVMNELSEFGLDYYLELGHAKTSNISALLPFLLREKHDLSKHPYIKLVAELNEVAQNMPAALQLDAQGNSAFTSNPRVFVVKKTSPADIETVVRLAVSRNISAAEGYLGFLIGEKARREKLFEKMSQAIKTQLINTRDHAPQLFTLYAFQVAHLMNDLMNISYLKCLLGLADKYVSNTERNTVQQTLAQLCKNQRTIDTNFGVELWLQLFRDMEDIPELREELCKVLAFKTFTYDTFYNHPRTIRTTLEQVSSFLQRVMSQGATEALLQQLPDILVKIDEITPEYESVEQISDPEIIPSFLYYYRTTVKVQALNSSGDAARLQQELQNIKDCLCKITTGDGIAKNFKDIVTSLVDAYRFYEDGSELPTFDYFRDVDKVWFNKLHDKLSQQFPNLQEWLENSGNDKNPEKFVKAELQTTLDEVNELVKIRAFRVMANWKANKDIAVCSLTRANKGETFHLLTNVDVAKKLSAQSQMEKLIRFLKNYPQITQMLPDAYHNILMLSAPAIRDTNNLSEWGRIEAAIEFLVDVNKDTDENDTQKPKGKGKKRQKKPQLPITRENYPFLWDTFKKILAFTAYRNLHNRARFSVSHRLFIADVLSRDESITYMQPFFEFLTVSAAKRKKMVLDMLSKYFRDSVGCREQLQNLVGRPIKDTIQFLTKQCFEIDVDMNRLISDPAEYQQELEAMMANKQKGFDCNKHKDLITKCVTVFVILSALVSMYNEGRKGNSKRNANAKKAFSGFDVPNDVLFRDYDETEKFLDVYAQFIEDVPSEYILVKKARNRLDWAFRSSVSLESAHKLLNSFLKEHLVAKNSNTVSVHLYNMIERFWLQDNIFLEGKPRNRIKTTGEILDVISQIIADTDAMLNKLSAQGKKAVLDSRALKCAPSLSIIGGLFDILPEDERRMFADILFLVSGIDDMDADRSKPVEFNRITRLINSKLNHKMVIGKSWDNFYPCLNLSETNKELLHAFIEDERKRWKERGKTQTRRNKQNKQTDEDIERTIKMRGLARFIASLYVLNERYAELGTNLNNAYYVFPESIGAIVYDYVQGDKAANFDDVQRLLQEKGILAFNLTTLKHATLSAMHGKDVITETERLIELEDMVDFIQHVSTLHGGTHDTVKTIIRRTRALRKKINKEKLDDDTYTKFKQELDGLLDTLTQEGLITPEIRDLYDNLLNNSLTRETIDDKQFSFPLISLYRKTLKALVQTQGADVLSSMYRDLDNLANETLSRMSDIIDNAEDKTQVMAVLTPLAQKLRRLAIHYNVLLSDDATFQEARHDVSEKMRLLGLSLSDIIGRDDANMLTHPTEYIHMNIESPIPWYQAVDELSVIYPSLDDVKKEQFALLSFHLGGSLSRMPDILTLGVGVNDRYINFLVGKGQTDTLLREIFKQQLAFSNTLVMSYLKHKLPADKFNDLNMDSRDFFMETLAESFNFMHETMHDVAEQIPDSHVDEKQQRDLADKIIQHTISIAKPQNSAEKQPPARRGRKKTVKTPDYEELKQINNTYEILDKLFEGVAWTNIDKDDLLEKIGAAGVSLLAISVL